MAERHPIALPQTRTTAGQSTGRGALLPRRVTRLYRNTTTTEWLRLTWQEGGEQKDIVTTPGHHFLDRHGRFVRIDRMLEDNRATIVFADGTLAEVTAERILYSAETAHQFERAVAFIDTGDGTAAKPVELDCWQTYNIEVEDLHTYVAGGVRVHNDSGPLGALANDIDAQVFDALGGLIGGPIGGLIDAFGNILTAPLHLAGEILDLLFPGYGDGGRSMTSSAANVGLDPTAAFAKPFLTVDKNGNPTGQPLSREPNPDNPLGRSDEEQQRAEANLKNWQRVFRNLTDNDRDNGSSSNSNSRQSDKDNVPAPSNLKKPVLLDLDGDGIEITELDRSTTFMDASGSGLKHRTAWAGKGDGVLFYDADNDGLISDDREYIFTEWDPTAGDNLAALRTRFDTNSDGKLSGTELASFTVLVTNADGSQTAETMAALGITEIGLLVDGTRIQLADGSAITGQASFVQGELTKSRAYVTLVKVEAPRRLEQISNNATSIRTMMQ